MLRLRVIEEIYDAIISGQKNKRQVFYEVRESGFPDVNEYETSHIVDDVARTFRVDLFALNIYPEKAGIVLGCRLMTAHVPGAWTNPDVKTSSLPPTSNVMANKKETGTHPHTMAGSDPGHQFGRCQLDLGR